MYPGRHARERAGQAAFIMASTGESVSYAEYEARTNRLAHLLRARGLGRLDHYAIFMENNDRYLEACGAGARAGLYFTCVNSYLTAPELAYILNNSTAKLLITSRACRDVALEAARECPGLTSGLIVDGTGDDGLFADFETATLAFPDTPIDDECLGTAMLYSSGTTGRPKGILRPLDDVPPGDLLPVFSFLGRLWRFREGLTYLSPAPLYHSAPLASVALAIRYGGTVIIMEKFDPEQYLGLVERYRVTHSQLVPTMFSRMLKLPEQVRSRYDLSSLEVAIHAAAPCPVPVKQQMIDWWGRSCWSTTARLRESASRPATPGNGSPIPAPSARWCSASCTSSTGPSSRCRRASPARCGSSKACRSAISMTWRRRQSRPRRTGRWSPSATSATSTRTATCTSPTAPPS